MPPPPNKDIPPPEPPKPGVTTRERFTKHDESMCATCHKLTDPIGFSFENYDAIGAYRQTDQGKPVDATGSLELEGQQLRFGNVIELRPRWRDRRRCKPAWPGSGCAICCAGRSTPGDEASLQLAGEAFQQSGFDMRELLVALVEPRVHPSHPQRRGEVAMSQVVTNPSAKQPLKKWEIARRDLFKGLGVGMACCRCCGPATSGARTAGQGTISMPTNGRRQQSWRPQWGRRGPDAAGDLRPRNRKQRHAACMIYQQLADHGGAAHGPGTPSPPGLGARTTTRGEYQCLPADHRPGGGAEVDDGRGPSRAHPAAARPAD